MRKMLLPAATEKEMAFERKLFEAGGVLMAGCDPTGDRHVIAGLGDQRNIELLSKAGFGISDVIKIATQNGATYLGLGDRIGSIAVGKQPIWCCSTVTWRKIFQ